MEPRSRLELANDNAAAHWLGMAGVEGWESRTGPGYTAVRCDRDAADSHRVVITRRPVDAEALTGELLELFRDWGTRQLCLEDPYRVLDLAGHGCEAAMPQAVMVREAGPLDPARTRREAPGLELLEAVREGELAEVERAVVEGFPVPARLPWRRGEMFPSAWGALRGRRSWLARRQGVTAGACVSWDDGTSVGLYWVAVLPEHRSQGVARALLERVLRAHPERPATLTATLLGEPLYRKLGFVEQGLATWWRCPAMSLPAARPVADRPVTDRPLAGPPTAVHPITTLSAEA